MSYKKDQGRYARMVGFWGLTLLVAYGCFHGGGLVTVLDRSLLSREMNPTLVEQFPLLGSLKVSTLIALAMTVSFGLLVHRVLNRPRIADSLIETEGEMYKVTWPNWGETWSGTVAVTMTVIVMFVYLTVVDVVLARVLATIMGN